MINYYQVLGLTRSAGQKEIKAAYRKLAVRYHPDKNPDHAEAEERFKEINQAYHVLSNPAKKFQYDLSLDQVFFEYPLPKTHGNRRPAARSYRYTTVHDSRLNRIGNIWALSFLFFTIILTVVSTIVNSYLERQRQSELLEKNILLFEDAKRDYNEGQYDAALIKINNISIIYSENIDVFGFKEDIYRKLTMLAGLHFDEGNFRSALSYYHLMLDHYRYIDNSVYYKIVDCHLQLGNYNDAIRILAEVPANGLRAVENQVKIAGIFKNSLQDHYNALEYYKLSVAMIENQYESMFGKAYAAVMDPRTMPDIHFAAYLGYGESLSYFGMYENAMNAFNWAIYLRPQNPEAYLQKGYCALKSGDTALACESVNEASRLGAGDSASMLWNICE